MRIRKICDDTSSMGFWELAHNMMFVKDGEVWYRDYEREIPLKDLMIEIFGKYTGEIYDSDISLDEFGEAILEHQQFGTETLEGVFAILYAVSWGAAELREWLKQYEENEHQKIGRILLGLHNIGGCDAQNDYAKGWDDSITEAIKTVEKESGTRIEEVLD